MARGIPVEQVVNAHFMETHRHQDGTPVSEEAEAQIAQHNEATRRVLEMRSAQESQGEASSNPFNALAEIRSVMGVEERHGRVHNLGFGARPSQVFGPRRNRNVNEPENPSQSYESRIRQRNDDWTREQLQLEREESRRERERLRLEREAAERAAAELKEMMARMERFQHDHHRGRRSPQGSSDDAV